jgi:hypothetical protein
VVSTFSERVNSRLFEVRDSLRREYVDETKPGERVVIEPTRVDTHHYATTPIILAYDLWAFVTHIFPDGTSKQELQDLGGSFKFRIGGSFEDRYYVETEPIITRFLFEEWPDPEFR